MLTSQNYHTDNRHISKTGLDLIHRAPYLYRYFRHGNKETKALILGRAYHEYFLEKDSFFLNWEVSTAPTQNGNLKSEDFDPLIKMEQNLLSIPEYNEFIVGAETEKIFLGTDAQTGIGIKCRVDAIKGNVISDLKFVDDASPDGFYRSIRKYRYNVQDAFYRHVLACNGIQIERFVFFAIEKKPPHLIGVYELSVDLQDDGEYMMRNDLNRYNECIQSNVWPMYTEGIVEL